MSDPHATNLEFTLRELGKKIREHEIELVKLQRHQSQTILSPAAQAKIITTAFETVTEQAPFLPFPESVLPSLLALRKTHATIVESKALVESQSQRRDVESRKLEADRASLKDQQLLTEALRARIQSLRHDLESSSDMRKEDALEEKLRGLQEKEDIYDKETRNLMKALLEFVNTQLAPMLAAEELGGPVVGDLMDVDAEDMVEGGFNQDGKPKKPKGLAGNDRRQQRIPDSWRKGGSGSRREDPKDFINQARQEMLGLTQDLLNRLVAAAGDNSESYVTLDRESAAARFLIRSKVAQFHPKDANKIRLIDFGRDLDD